MREGLGQTGPIAMAPMATYNNIAIVLSFMVKLLDNVANNSQNEDEGEKMSQLEGDPIV